MSPKPRFGLWTPVGKPFKKVSGETRRTFQRVVCQCGETRDVQLSTLTSGRSTSCGGCQTQNRTHGKTGTRTYYTWAQVVSKARKGGPAVCRRWQTFEGFLADLGEKPPRSRLERRNKRLGWGPANAYWRKFQSD